MNFLVIGKDGHDKDAPKRRAEVRDQHLQAIAKLKQQGTLIEAGVMLDDDGNMVGSAIFMDFPDRAALDKWLADEIYVKHGVWQDIEITQVRFPPWQDLLAKYSD